jgi:hypothetical protein
MIALDDVLVRSLDVTVRRWEDGGLLLETYIGRYTLNPDARMIWHEINGRASVGAVAARLSASEAVDLSAMTQAVTDLCQRLLDLRLIERV